MKSKFLPFQTVQSLCRCLDYFVTDDPNSIPWPEIIFYIICLMITASSSFYLFAGQSEIAWQFSMSALSTNLTRQGQHLGIYLMSEEHYLASGFLFAASMIGIKSAYSGYEAGLYAYIGVMIVSIGLETHSTFLLSVRGGDCARQHDELREVLRFHVNNYYEEAEFMGFKDKFRDPQTNSYVNKPLYRRKYKSATLMTSMQQSLGCCGYDNHYDYLDKSRGAQGFRDPLGESDKITLEVPGSCCKRLYAPNIHCAVELWNGSDAELRLQIYTEGCTYRIVELCHRIFSQSLNKCLLIIIAHIILLLCSVPLIIIQARILRQLASENPFSYTFTHQATLQTLEEFEELDQGGDSLYAHDFHRDSDFVLKEEAAILVDELRNKFGIVGGEGQLRDLPRNVLLVRNEGDHNGVDGVEVKLPFSLLQAEDKVKIMESGRFNRQMSRSLLLYAASVLNMRPDDADAAMKQAELLARMNAYNADDRVSDESLY